MAARLKPADLARHHARNRALGRCSNPACRTRKDLGFLKLVPGSRGLSEGDLVVLCGRCLRRARRGAFDRDRMLAWKMRNLDLYENVGAE